MNKVKKQPNKENKLNSNTKSKRSQSQKENNTSKTLGNSASRRINDKNKLKITKLILENFKSFEGKHEIGLFQDFNVVLGPNGSGKSNIIDAICFALGMKTASLRTKNLRELIYKKDYENDDNKRTAFVEIFFIQDGDEVSFKRTISSKGVSDFYCMNKKMNLDEYMHKLEMYNIPSKARYFILVQGAIDTMLSKKNDLTETIEYLSGSHEEKTQYVQLSEEIASLNNQISKLSSEIHNLKDDRNKVKVQIENEAQYNSLMEKLNKLIEKIYLYRLAEMDLTIISNNEKLKENDHSLDVIQNEKKSIIDSLKTTETQLKKLEQTFRVSEQDNALVKEVEEIKQKIHQASENIKIYDNFIFSKVSMLNQQKMDKKKKDEKVGQLRSQNDIYEKRAEEIRKKINAEVPEGKVNKAQIIEYREISQIVEKETFELRKDIEIIEQKVTDNINKKGLCEKTQTKLEGERLNLDNDLKEFSDKLVKEKIYSKKLEGEIESLKKNINEKEEEKNKLDSDFESVEGSLKEKLDKLSIFESENIENIKRRKIAELIHKNSNVFGFLYELITPLQKRHEIPIKISLLKYLGYLVVENEETAKVCSEFLKSKEINADLLVLENIPQKDFDESIRLKLGNMGNFVVDLIDCRKKGVKNAVSYFLKDMVLCYEKDNISKLKAKGFNSIISQEGTLYKKGTITGGNYKSLEQYSFNYRPNSEFEIDKLRKETSGLIKQLEDIQSKRADFKELISLKNSLIEKENQLEIAIKNIKMLTESLERVKTNIEVKMTGIGRNNASLHEFEEAIRINSVEFDAMKEKFKSIQNKHFKEFMKKYSMVNLSDFESYSISEIRKLSEELKSLEEKIIKINSQIQILESGEEAIIKLEKILQADKDKKKAYEEERLELESQYKTISTKYNEANSEKNQEKEKIDKLNEDIKNNQSELDRIDKRIRGLIKNKTELKHLISQSVDNKNQIIEESKINQNNYLTEINAGSSFTVNINVNMEEYIFAKESMGFKLNPVIDYKAIETKAKITEKSIGDITEKISKGKEKFSEYMKEIDKYIKLVSLTECEAKELKTKEEGLHNKKKELNLQVQTLVTELDSKKTEFIKVKLERKKKFDEFFKKVVDNITNVYKELTKPQDSSNPGGSAYIYATNEDEPYLGSICYLPTPPGKRVIYDIDQLSGGEKTIAILSLVISLQTICETPFVVLDEIDSYLDPEHEQILENLFQKHHKQFQIIIVTHKSTIFRSAHSLIGTYFNKAKYTSIPITVDNTKLN
jgi:structural maintenance of chromosome 1